MKLFKNILFVFIAFLAINTNLSGQCCPTVPISGVTGQSTPTCPDGNLLIFQNGALMCMDTAGFGGGGGVATLPSCPANNILVSDGAGNYTCQPFSTVTATLENINDSLLVLGTDTINICDFVQIMVTAGTTSNINDASNGQSIGDCKSTFHFWSDAGAQIYTTQGSHRIKWDWDFKGAANVTEAIDLENDVILFDNVSITDPQGNNTHHQNLTFRQLIDAFNAGDLTAINPLGGTNTTQASLDSLLSRINQLSLSGGSDGVVTSITWNPITRIYTAVGSNGGANASFIIADTSGLEESEVAAMIADSILNIMVTNTITPNADSSQYTIKSFVNGRETSSEVLFLGEDRVLTCKEVLDCIPNNTSNRISNDTLFHTGIDGTETFVVLPGGGGNVDIQNIGGDTFIVDADGDTLKQSNPIIYIAGGSNFVKAQPAGVDTFWVQYWTEVNSVTNDSIFKNDTVFYKAGGTQDIAPNYRDSVITYRAGLDSCRIEYDLDVAGNITRIDTFCYQKYKLCEKVEPMSAFVANFNPVQEITQISNLTINGDLYDLGSGTGITNLGSGNYILDGPNDGFIVPNIITKSGDYIEMEIEGIHTTMGLGFNYTNPIGVYNVLGVDFLLRQNSNTAVGYSIREETILAGSDFGFEKIGDVIRVERVDNRIAYYVNSQLVHISPLQTFQDTILLSENCPTELLVNDPLTIGEDGKISMQTLKCEIDVPIEYFTDEVNMISINDTLFANNAVQNWGNNGAFGHNKLKAGNDGSVEITLTKIPTNGTDGIFMFGLSPSNLNEHFNTISYATYIQQIVNNLTVFENGSNEGTFAAMNTLSIGDKLKVERKDSVITYLLNDVIYYTSLTKNGGNLYFDLAFYAGNNTIPVTFEGFEQNNIVELTQAQFNEAICSEVDISNFFGTKTVYFAGTGQSNMLGQAGLTGDVGSDPRITIANGTNWVDPVGFLTDNSPLWQAAKAYLRENPTKNVRLILHAEAATSINTFLAGGTNIAQFDAKMAAVGNPKLDAMYFSQGEADRLGFNINAAALNIREANENYYNAVNQYYSELTAKPYFDDTTPFVMSTLLQDEAVRQDIYPIDGIKRLGLDENPYTLVYDASHLPSFDGIHYTGQSVDIMGERAYQAFKSAPYSLFQSFLDSANQGDSNCPIFDTDLQAYNDTNLLHGDCYRIKIDDGSGVPVANQPYVTRFKN